MTDHISSSPQNPASTEIVREGIGLKQEIPGHFRKDISDISQNIKELYPKVGEQINQLGKFQHALQEALEDEACAEMYIPDLILEWNTILRNRRVEATEQKVEATEQKVEQDTATKATEKATMATVEEKTKASISEKESHLRTQTLALTNQLSSLTGGKPFSALIPDYETKLKQAEQDLVLQGKDPKLAESVVLLSNEKTLIQAVHQYAKDSGKPLSEDDLKTLRSSFDSLRSSASDLKLPSHSPTALALRDPNITPEVYSKIKAGFEPPSQTVWPNPVTGEYLSQAKLLTGERTIMTSEGKRFREKAGLRIESPVPEGNQEVFSQAQELTISKLVLKHRESTVQTRQKEIVGDLATILPKNLFPNNKLPDISSGTTEQTIESLKKFYTSPDWRAFNTGPASKLGLEQAEYDRYKKLIDTSLRGCYHAVLNRDETKKKIELLESKKPEFILQEQIKNQDSVADKNLDHLTKIGVQYLGQETYQLLINRINHSLKIQAKPPIDNTKQLAPEQSQTIKEGFLAVIGLDAKTAYPDGRIDPKAILGKIQTLPQPVSAEKIDELLAKAKEEVK